MSEITTSNEKETIKIGDNGGFFDSIVRPMFQSGHEGELHTWLKDMSLIRSSLSCSNPDCNERNLTWHSARVVDRFSWKCLICRKNYAIRDSSFFHSVKCDFKTALELILGWCQNIPPKTIASITNTKDFNARKVYERCTKIADTWVMSHINEYLFGGPGKVLVIYEYPGGNMLQDGIEIVKTKKRNNSPTILCIIEANNIPPKMWFHIMQTMPEQINHKNDDTFNDIKKKDNTFDEAIDVIKRHILPGSFIVANKNSKCFNFNAIVELKNYQTFSIDVLEQFDNNDTQKLRDNLATIWQSAVDICEDVLESQKSQGQSIISSYLWRQKFYFQNMLHQIADEYRFK
ncbi:uncharacterized protein LOC122857316 [Aphidius gifuensis]|uniref:uncharacterized protein LOC122857316 n=1 Tax=Aphidius gifuensis TaxID=684658 RepID=UPI001CDD10B4|nr:uncharacterized protein LOC122857316 [Aphidius gifuensis]